MESAEFGAFPPKNTTVPSDKVLTMYLLDQINEQSLNTATKIERK
jgi:hypothetical protein